MRRHKQRGLVAESTTDEAQAAWLDQILFNLEWRKHSSH